MLQHAIFLFEDICWSATRVDSTSDPELVKSTMTLTQCRNACVADSCIGAVLTKAGACYLYGADSWLQNELVSPAEDLFTRNMTCDSTGINNSQF